MSLPKASIYTDGSCNPQTGIGGWAAVIVFEDSSAFQELFGSASQTTSNQMEFLAVLRALEWLDHPHDITIFTDSQLLIQYVGGCKKNNLALLRLYAQIALAVEKIGHNVSYEKIDAHTGDVFNELADSLASKARRATPNG